MTNSNESQANALLEVFTFNQNSTPIRVQVIDNEPWFVAKDVCDVLEIADTEVAMRRLDDDEKLTLLIYGSGQGRNMWHINESGLYAVILQSRKPKAKPFRKWVTSEVLPSIRKRGYYGVKKQSTDFIDARDIPYTKEIFNGNDIRCITIEGEKWLSLNDFHAAIGSRTGSAQAVKKLNVKKIHAQKIFLFGNTHPAWFITMAGAKLLLSSSHKMQQGRQFMLEFKEEEE